MKQIVVVLGCSAALAACVSTSSSRTMATLPADLVGQGRVAEIRLNQGDIKVSPGFEKMFRAQVQAKLDGCATGARPLRLDASIQSFDRTNPVITTVLAGRNRIRGEARLMDIGTGQEVGVYQIGHTVIGGKLGIVAMGQAEKQLSTAFGSELCKQAFSKKAPTASAPGAPRGS